MEGANSEPVTLRVVGTGGRLLHTEIIEVTTDSIRRRVPLSAGSGVYLLQITTPTRSHTAKLVRY
ncbi:T9SS type A sorting domain-containing protein [Rudanella paleaurantiibacter]|uniref:T9SS type A sorting domain-containing protein n=1 Tax=Rudanella paleaurantiibacter TaxID=2614655 RepID=UPI0037449074